MPQPPPAAGFRTIVCGVDFSRHSGMALRYAAALARRSRAHVVAVFAIDPFLSAAAAAAYDTGALGSTSLLELRRFVRATLGRTAAAGVSCEVVVGKPARAIVSLAGELHADLLVLGTHGLSGVKRVFFGSTSAAVLRQAPLPVLAIPRRCPALRRNWPEAGIVGAVHFGSTLTRDAGAVSDVAASLAVPLDLVVTVAAVRAPLWLRAHERAINRGRVATAQSWLDERLTRDAPGLAATHVLVGDQAEDIARFAAELGADVLIVTVPAARGARRLVEGHTAYRLLCIARSPVLVLPRRVAGSKTKSRSGLHNVA
jgi:nucleotide-binding universal stress UspA family protein